MVKNTIKENLSKDGIDGDFQLKKKRIAEEYSFISKLPGSVVQFNILRTSNLIKRYMANIDRKYHYMNRRPTDVLLILALNPDGLTPSVLSNLTLRSRQIISHIISDLEKEGYVVRSRIKNNNRTIIVNLTDKGLNFMEERLPIYVKIRDIVAKMYDEKEINELERILKNVRKNIFKSKLV